jgi:hypothetical protein
MAIHAQGVNYCVLLRFDVFLERSDSTSLSKKTIADICLKDGIEEFVNIILDACTQTGSKLLQLSAYARFYVLPSIEWQCLILSLML